MHLHPPEPPPRRACLSGPDARREVQSTFSPKMTFRVRLPPSPTVSPGGGLPVTLGAEGHRWRTRCAAAAREMRRAGVKEALVLVLRVRVDGSSAAALKGEVGHFRVRISAPRSPRSALGGISPPTHRPADPQLAAPPFPAATGAPPGPLGLAEPAFWAPPPVLPGSCCPQLCSRRRHRGRTKSLLPRLGLGAAGRGGRGRGGGGKETPEGALNELK